MEKITNLKIELKKRDILEATIKTKQAKKPENKIGLTTEEIITNLRKEGTIPTTGTTATTTTTTKKLVSSSTITKPLAINLTKIDEFFQLD